MIPATPCVIGPAASCNAEALQLAAAPLRAGQPQGSAFVTPDERLAAAAALEGFTPLPPASPRGKGTR